MHKIRYCRLQSTVHPRGFDPIDAKVKTIVIAEIGGRLTSTGYMCKYSKMHYNMFTS